jgi:hypothetical protein
MSDQIVKRVLDESTRKLLKGYTPFDSKSFVNFTPKEFQSIKDESIRPIFTIRSLSQSEMTQLKKNSLSYKVDMSKEELSKIGEQNLDIIKNCILGWSNFFDAGTGEEITFNVDTFKTFPVWLSNTIMEEVKNMSGLTSVDDLGLK